MEISKNIIFDEEHFAMNNTSFHKKQLEIVSLNLDDFNRRFNSNIMLNYDQVFNAFSLSSNNEVYGSVFTRQISHCLAFYNDKNWKEEDFITYDFYLLAFIYNHLYSTIKEKKSECTQDVEFVSELDLFIKRNDNYSPLGILSAKGEVEYKNRLQKMVDSLKSLINSIAQ